MESNQEIVNRYLIFKKECIEKGIFHIDEIIKLFVELEELKR